MVDGVILLVDAAEGTMPQTRFVLQKALELKHKIIVVVNKIDRPDARLDQVGDEVLELLLDLDADEEQLESPILYCSGREGTASFDFNEKSDNLIPLFDTILNYIPSPEGDENAPLQVLVSSIDYNEYVGRLGIGKIERGQIKSNQDVMVCNFIGEEKDYKSKIVNIYKIEGLKREQTEDASVGEIVCFSGIENVTIGNTICSLDNPEPIPFANITAPTLEMTFSVNDSPFAGTEGKFVTSRQLRDRLFKELLKDVSLRVEDSEKADKFIVSGRGEMHFSILIETMRREGFELAVSTPRVLYKTIDGHKNEPIELLTIDVPEEYVGTVMEKMGLRKSELISMNPQGSRTKMEFLIPSRGLFGYRSQFLTDTKGEGILNSVFHEYQPYKGDITTRTNGSLISFETGEAVTYGLYNAQSRGTLYISPGTKVYQGMVVGFSPKSEDMVVNVCKKKQVTNMRASGTDDALRLITPKNLSLEEALENLAQDEFLEVTPKNIRIRKQILNTQLRSKSNK